MGDKAEGKAFQSRWGANCVACGTRYAPGDWIVSRGRGRGAVHEKCHELSAEVIAEREAEQAAEAEALNEGARDRARAGRYGPIGDWAADTSSITPERMAYMRLLLADGAEAMENRPPPPEPDLRNLDPQVTAQFAYLRRCLETGRALRAKGGQQD